MCKSMLQGPEAVGNRGPKGAGVPGADPGGAAEGSGSGGSEAVRSLAASDRQPQPAARAQGYQGSVRGDRSGPVDGTVRTEQTAGQSWADAEANAEEAEGLQFAIAGRRYRACEGCLFVLRASKEGPPQWEAVGPYVRVTAVIRDLESSRTLVEIEVEEEDPHRHLLNGFSISEFEKATATPVVRPKDFERFIFEAVKGKDVCRITIPPSAGWQEDGSFWPSPRDIDLLCARDGLPGAGSIFRRSNCDRQHEFVKRCLGSHSQAGLLYVLSVASLFLKPCGAGSLVVVLDGQDSLQKVAARLAVQLFYKPKPPGPKGARQLQKLLRYLKDLPVVVEAFGMTMGSADGRRDLRMELSEMRNVVFLYTGGSAVCDPRPLDAGSAWLVLRSPVGVPMFPFRGFEPFSVMDSCVGCGFDYVAALCGEGSALCRSLERGRREVEALCPHLRAPGWIHAAASALVFLEEFYQAEFPAARGALRNLLRATSSPTEDFIMRLRTYIAKVPEAVYDDRRPAVAERADQVQVRVSGDQCYVRRDLFRRLCTEVGVAPEKVLELLEREGRVVKKDGRYQTVQRLIPNGPVSRCYCIWLPELCDPELQSP